MTFLSMEEEPCLWSLMGSNACCGISLKRLIRKSSVALHTREEEGGVHAVQVKRRDDRLPGQPKNTIKVNLETNRGSCSSLLPLIFMLCLSLVSDVAGVVDPHQLTKTLAPPRAQMQSHVEAVLCLWRRVPPAEPIPLKLGRFLLEKLQRLQAVFILTFFCTF